MEALAGRPVLNRTPDSQPRQRHPVVQIPSLDIKKSTTRGRVAAILRAAMVEFADYRRVGVLIDKKHVPVVKGTSRGGENLEACFRDRICKVAHFRGGDSRGSNSWLADGCDLLIVAGTPRVPPTVVRTRLIQAGQTAAAARNGRWEKDWWSGIDCNGKRHTIATAAYRDHDWHDAHKAVVHAELVQAIGRGRCVCENGIPVVVLSNENLGHQVHYKDLEPLPEADLAMLRSIVELTEQFPAGLGPSS